MPTKKYDEPVTILENRKVNDKYYKLTFRSKPLSRQALPGQFLNIQIQPLQDFFLRRPFSYYRIEGDRIHVLYEILGKGTAMLAAKKKGARLQVLGPLGKTFTAKAGKKKKILVAGGVGVPPLIFLAEKYPADYLLIGSKSKAEVMPRRELAKVRAEIQYATNDGSYGAKGYVTVLLQKLIQRFKSEELFIQTCGPTVMMQAVMQLARKAGIEGEASLDKEMACGLGVCLGCMVKTPAGWVPSCTQGPVFNFRDIEEA